MNLTRCENGHFYDAERFETCPHCNQTSVSTVLQDENGSSVYTMPVSDVGTTLPVTAPAPAPVQEPIVGKLSELENSQEQKTVGFYDEALKTEPVVGWLVSVDGSSVGQDFKLKTGRNFIGRSANMDVSLPDDSSISRDKHAIILYEPKGNMYIVQPGDAKELFYLNEKVVLSAEEIHAYDVLSLGNTKLVFIPLCSNKFHWDDYKKEDKDKEKEDKLAK